MRFIVDGLQYAKVVELQAELRAAGVENGIVPGGLGMWPEGNTQTDSMMALCLKYGRTPEEGKTLHESLVTDFKREVREETTVRKFADFPADGRVVILEPMRPAYSFVPRNLENEKWRTLTGRGSIPCSGNDDCPVCSMQYKNRRRKAKQAAVTARKRRRYVWR